jgi:hypothetical protein
MLRKIINTGSVHLLDPSVVTISKGHNCNLLFADETSPENKPKLIAECQAADAIVLTYACDRPSTLDRLSTYWLPELRRLEVFLALNVLPFT